MKRSRRPSKKPRPAAANRPPTAPGELRKWDRSSARAASCKNTVCASRTLRHLAAAQELPALNSARRIVFWKCGPLFTTYDQPAAHKFDLLANADCAADDPGFVDAAKGDFRLKRNAELFRRISFRPIPVEEIGLYQDEYRAN